MSKHCCVDIQKHILGNEVCINYIPKFREYGLLIKDGGSSFQEIYYCPWCGKKLPVSLRDKWCDIIYDEMDLDGSDDPNIPEDMKSEKWWATE